jgi:ribosomal protein S25
MSIIKLSQISVPTLSWDLKIFTSTARNCLNKMVKFSILEEASSKKRDKIYIYRKYLNILE